MKRIWMLTGVAVLLCACGGKTVEQAPPSPPAAESAAPAVEQAESAVSCETSALCADTPAAPTALQTADPFSAYFSDEPVREARSYRSKNVSVTIESFASDETYGRHVTYHVADIHVRSVKSIRAEAAQGDFFMRYTRQVREIAHDAGALVAIAGDSYTRVHESFVIRNGVLYRDTPIENTDLCILYRDGVMETKKWGAFDVQAVIDSEPWQVWGFGPALLDEDGKATDIHHRLMGHNPRTAIGYYEPGHYCFVVVDGRGDSVGVTLNSLSRLMEDLGCKAAYNLDGGGSAQLYWDGEIVSAACNDTRVIGDIIYLLPEE